MHAPGGGWRAAAQRDSELEQAFETARDPIDRRPKVKRSSIQHLSTPLKQKGHAVSRLTVLKLLRKLK